MNMKFGSLVSMGRGRRKHTQIQKNSTELGLSRALKSSEYGGSHENPGSAFVGGDDCTAGPPIINPSNFFRGSTALVLGTSADGGNGTHQNMTNVDLPRRNAKDVQIIENLRMAKSPGIADDAPAKQIAECEPVEIDIFNAKVRTADMPSFMQLHALRSAAQLCETQLNEIKPIEVASSLKKEFDRAYGPLWHCIVGRSFGSFLTHSIGGFVYFSIGKLCILLFKTTVEPR